MHNVQLIYNERIVSCLQWNGYYANTGAILAAG